MNELIYPMDLDKGYNPNQPREPAGSSEGGQWTSVSGRHASDDEVRTALRDRILDAYSFIDDAPAENRNALRYYMRNKFSGFMAGVRSGDLEAADRVAAIDELLTQRKLTELPYLYRGLKGKDINLDSDDPFVSTTLTLSQAKQWAGTSGTVLAIEQPPGGFTGFYAERYWNSAKARANRARDPLIGEAEFLLRGARFEKVGEEDKQGTRVVTVRVAGVKKYSPNQPRHPKGVSEGGQFRGYHGTRDEVIDKILSEGLISNPPSRNFLGSLYRDDRGKSVYIAKELHSAKGYAIGTKIGTGNLFKGSVVLEVEVPAEFSDKIKVDEYDDSALRFVGNIPPEWIKAVHRPTNKATFGEEGWEVRRLRKAAGRTIYVVVDLDKYAQEHGIKKYDPNQPRVPAGYPDGGQWTEIVLYRGTVPGQPLAQASTRGRFGPGLYLSRQPGVAGVYGNIITEYRTGVPLFDASPRWLPEKRLAEIEEALFARMTPDEQTRVRDWWPKQNAKVSTGEDIWEIISRKLGDDRAQELIRTMGYKGIDGIGDGAETVIFNPADARIWKAFDPNQPRHPKGVSEGGQWTSGVTVYGGKAKPESKPGQQRDAVKKELEALAKKLGLQISVGDYSGANQANWIISANFTHPKWTSTRHFIMDDGELIVEHANMSVDSSAQKQGYSKMFLTALMDSYEKLGVDKIKIETTSVGSYAWARYGFKPTALRVLGELKYAVNNRLNKWMGLIPDEVHKVAKAAVRGGDIWALSDLRYDVDGEPLGYRLLEGTGWSGEFDLHDKASMDRFNAYTGRKVSKAFNPNQPREPKGTEEGGQWRGSESKPTPSTGPRKQGTIKLGNGKVVKIVASEKNRKSIEALFTNVGARMLDQLSLSNMEVLDTAEQAHAAIVKFIKSKGWSVPPQLSTPGAVAQGVYDPNTHNMFVSMHDLHGKRSYDTFYHELAHSAERKSSILQEWNRSFSSGSEGMADAFMAQAQMKTRKTNSKEYALFKKMGWLE